MKNRLTNQPIESFDRYRAAGISVWNVAMAFIDHEFEYAGLHQPIVSAGVRVKLRCWLNSLTVNAPFLSYNSFGQDRNLHRLGFVLARLVQERQSLVRAELILA